MENKLVNSAYIFLLVLLVTMATTTVVEVAIEQYYDYQDRVNYRLKLDCIADGKEPICVGENSVLTPLLCKCP